MNNQHGDEPLKHVKRPSESRSEMHHRSSRSQSESATPRRTRVQQDSTLGDQQNGNKNSTKIWASLIILAILVIALVPIINTQMHKSKANLAEKTVQTSSVKSKKKKVVKSVSKKPAKKAKKENKREENKSSSVIEDNSQSKEDDVQESAATTSESTIAPATNTAGTDSNNFTSGSSYSDSSQITQYTAPSTYKVQDGDSLYKIAADNGTTVENLKKINGIADDVVNPGQSIKLN